METFGHYFSGSTSSRILKFVWVLSLGCGFTSQSTISQLFRDGVKFCINVYYEILTLVIAFPSVNSYRATVCICR